MPRTPDIQAADPIGASLWRGRGRAYLAGLVLGVALYFLLAWQLAPSHPRPEPKHTVIVVETFDEDRTRGLLERMIDGQYTRSQFVGDKLVEWHPHGTNKTEIVVSARYSTGPHLVRFDATEIVKLEAAGIVCRVHIHVTERGAAISQCLPPVPVSK